MYAQAVRLWTLALVLTALPAIAQDLPLTLPPITPSTFTYHLVLIGLPGTAFSAGWDLIVPVVGGAETIALTNTTSLTRQDLIRAFYRHSDGLLVFVLEDGAGIVRAQSPAWLIGTDWDILNITIHPTVKKGQRAALIVMAYDRETGTAQRFALYW